MKRLETLIPDIEELLTALSGGQPLEIPPEELDKTVNNIREAIEHWAVPQHDNKFTLRMSNIGLPNRRLWMEKHRPKTDSISPAVQFKFLYGHVVEQLALMLARISGHTVTDEQQEIEIDGILGHQDSRIDGEVVDVKTTTGYGFSKFKYNRLEEDDPFGYIPQLSGYEAAGETNEGGFFAIDRSSGAIALHRPEQSVKIDARKRIAEAKEILEMPEPPEELCYEPEPMGESGNIKIGKGCNWCPHKFECFDNLRSFKYAKGLVHLCHVEKEPKVEEVL